MNLNVKNFYILKENLTLRTGDQILPGTILYREDPPIGDLWLPKVFYTEDERHLEIVLGDYIPKMQKLPKYTDIEHLELARLLFS